jgi:hypothetical protein
MRKRFEALLPPPHPWARPGPTRSYHCARIIRSATDAHRPEPRPRLALRFLSARWSYRYQGVPPCRRPTTSQSRHCGKSGWLTGQASTQAWTCLRRLASHKGRPLPQARLPCTIFQAKRVCRLRVHQSVIVTPAQHKTHGKGRERAEPDEACIAAVKDVEQQSPPELGHLAQELAFLIAHPGFPRPRARS